MDNLSDQMDPLGDDFKEERSGDSDDAPLREWDRLLPYGNICKIMKRVLPKNIRVSKKAVECMQECVSEFISFITSEATDNSQDLVHGDLILVAMRTLGFDNYVYPLTLYMNKYRPSNKIDLSIPAITFDQTNLRNETNASTSNTSTTIINTNETIAGTATDNIQSGGCGVPFGEIEESASYYDFDDDSEIQLFQL